MSKPAFDQNLLAVVGPKVLEVDSSRAEEASKVSAAGRDHNAANLGGGIIGPEVDLHDECGWGSLRRSTRPG
jgi:hypothetical protein